MRNTVHHPITNEILEVRDTARTFTHAVVIRTGVISMHSSEKAAHRAARAHNLSRGYYILPVVDGDKPAPAPLNMHPAWYGRNDAGKWVEIKPAAAPVVESAPAAAPAVEPAPAPAVEPAVEIAALKAQVAELQAEVKKLEERAEARRESTQYMIDKHERYMNKRDDLIDAQAAEIAALKAQVEELSPFTVEYTAPAPLDHHWVFKSTKEVERAIADMTRWSHLRACPNDRRAAHQAASDLESGALIKMMQHEHAQMLTLLTGK
jgi:hypothetical protein